MKLPMELEICCRTKAEDVFESSWDDDGRKVRSERRRNMAGSFILISVRDAERKHTLLLFQEDGDWRNGERDG